MSDLKHTPGPWSVRSDFVGPLRVMAGDIDIALVGALKFFDAQSNAHLIAAAPELLKALKGVRGIVCSRMCPRIDDNVMGHDDLCKAVRDAIEKAEGRS